MQLHSTFSLLLFLLAHSLSFSLFLSAHTFFSCPHPPQLVAALERPPDRHGAAGNGRGGRGQICEGWNREEAAGIELMPQERARRSESGTRQPESGEEAAGIGRGGRHQEHGSRNRARCGQNRRAVARIWRVMAGIELMVASSHMYWGDGGGDG
jgi:hypothetical protein